MERLQTFNVGIRKSNIKYPIEKSIFAATLPLKLFPATVANANIGSLKSLHTFLQNIPVKFKQNRMVENIQNLTKKPDF